MKIFEGHGLSLHKRENNYYIRYMAGEIASWLVEIKVTPEEAGQVQISVRQANEVVYKYQNQCYIETGRYWKKVISYLRRKCVGKDIQFQREHKLRFRKIRDREFMKDTLNTDFSSLNGPKAANWIMDFQNIAEQAFADSSSYSRILGNLLILEPYVHTLRQSLADRGRTVSDVCQEVPDVLWDYLEGKKTVFDL